MTQEELKVISTDPFLAGRTEAAERYGHLAKNAAQWRFISGVLILCCAACVLAVIRMSGSVTVVPYIVQVDEHGYTIAVAPVAPSKVDSRLIIAQIGRYIWSMKTVFHDPEAQLHLMNFIYLTTPQGTPAEQKYKEYYSDRANNPVIVGDLETVNVTINSVLSLSPDTWQAEWTEDRHNTEGKRVSSKHYRGVFTVAVAPPKAMQDVLANPLGIFITDFTFSEVL